MKYPGEAKLQPSPIDKFPLTENPYLGPFNGLDKGQFKLADRVAIRDFLNRRFTTKAALNDLFAHMEGAYDIRIGKAGEDIAGNTVSEMTLEFMGMVGRRGWATNLLESLGYFRAKSQPESSAPAVTDSQQDFSSSLNETKEQLLARVRRLEAEVADIQDYKDRAANMLSNHLDRAQNAEKALRSVTAELDKYKGLAEDYKRIAADTTQAAKSYKQQLLTTLEKIRVLESTQAVQKPLLGDLGFGIDRKPHNQGELNLFADPNEDTVKIKTLLGRYFDISDIEGIAFNLNIDYDNLRGDTKVTKIESLISFVVSRNRSLEPFRAIMLNERPNLRTQLNTIEWHKVY